MYQLSKKRERTKVRGFERFSHSHWYVIFGWLKMNVSYTKCYELWTNILVYRDSKLCLSLSLGLGFMSCAASSPMAATMTSYDTSMTTRLISKLSLSNQEESVDLWNLRCLEKDFVSPRFYMLKKLNTVQAVPFEPFRSAVRSMWRLSSPMDACSSERRSLSVYLLR